MQQLAAFLNSQPLIWSLLGLLAGFILFMLAAGRLRRSNNPFSEPLAAIGILLLPTCAVLAVLLDVGHFDVEHRYVKLIETILGVEIIWTLLTLLKASVLYRTLRRGATSTISGVFLDLLRVALVLLGAIVVFATVWNKDITNFLATLGVGSVVIGLALQETLGNLFAGIALVFERPFKVGDWIKVGDLIGEVKETNWRSVRLLSREHVMLVVPNSVLGRERIENFSQPSRVVGMTTTVGFSYNDPPNKVKKVLFDVLRGTHGVVFEPRPRIRTLNFADFAVTYQVKFFIRDYFELPEIEEEFKTRVWYAARRHGLNIPYPIRVVYKTEVPHTIKPDQATELTAALSRLPLFSPLRSNEIDALARDTLVMEFGHGEKIVEQGDRGDSLFVVQNGTAVVTVQDETGREREVSKLSKGDLFGEMALLTGEPRTATVTAESDMTILVVYKESLQELFNARPELAAQMAETAESRRTGLREAQAQLANSTIPEKALSRGDALLGKIKLFFGIDSQE